jgi:hypothetical protein
MAHEPDDLGDARSRQEVRRFREQFHGGGSVEPDRSFEPSYFWGRWIPLSSRTMSGSGTVMACLGAVMVVILLAVAVAGRFW